MEDTLYAEGQNLLYIFPDEMDFFDKFLEKKGIRWVEEQRKVSVLSLSKSLTGYIKTPRRTIDIEPKYKEIKLVHIIRLYNYVYSYRDTQDDELLDIDTSNQSENLVDSFLKKLRENISIGILQEYAIFEQKSKYLKGNVEYVSTYKDSMKLRTYPVKTKMYTLSLDIDLNRLIVGALKIISQSGRYNSESMELLGYFNNHVEAITNNASEYLQNIHFNSKNIRYKKIVSQAAMIIDSLYYDSLKGNVGGESFLVNFDILFEKFVKKILIEETTERSFSIWNEPKLLGKEYLNGVVVGSRLYQPDIVYNFIQEDEERGYQPTAEAVLDVKNKANGVFKNSDVYQIMLYNQLLYAKKSILIYPSFYSKPTTILTIENNIIPVPEIYSVFIDIATPNTETFKKAIYNLIEDVFQVLEK